MVRKKNYISLLVILALALICWLLIKDIIGHSDGVGYGHLLEKELIFQSSEADHILWHELSWLGITVGRWIDPAMRGVMAEQIVNLLLFAAALIALWYYLQVQGKEFWFTGLGVVASFASIKTLISEDVDVGPLLMMTLLLFILPGVIKHKRTLWVILILTLALLFHKSLLLLIAGWWLAEVALGDEKPLKRLIYASGIILTSTIIALAYYFLTWLLFLSGKQTFLGWYFPYGGNITNFMAFDPILITKCLGSSLYRAFFHIVPVKYYLMGNVWGLLGIILSVAVIALLLFLNIKALWKKRETNTGVEENPRRSFAIILSLLPAVIFFIFWMPGYSDYWSRFIPAFWVILTLQLPQTTIVNGAKYAAIGLLLLINLPSQYIAKNGEESGLIIRWLEPKVQAGDLIVLPSNGVFYSGVVPQYYCRADVLTIGDIWQVKDPIAYLQSRLNDKWQTGHNAWFVLDYTKWNSARMLYNDDTSVTSQIKLIKQTFKMDSTAELKDPSLEEVWIGRFIPR